MMLGNEPRDEQTEPQMGLLCLRPSARHHGLEYLPAHSFRQTAARIHHAQTADIGGGFEVQPYSAVGGAEVEGVLEQLVQHLGQQVGRALDRLFLYQKCLILAAADGDISDGEEKSLSALKKALAVTPKEHSSALTSVRAWIAHKKQWEE